MKKQIGWTLARTDKSDVGKLAVLLRVHNRASAYGGFNNTSALFLLDRKGRVLENGDRLGSVPDPVFLAAAQRVVDVDGGRVR